MLIAAVFLLRRANKKVIQHQLGVIPAGHRLVTVVLPLANRPASRIALFTCALATGEWYSMPRNFAPVIRSGGLSFGPSAVIIRSHLHEGLDDAIHRPACESEASPTSRLSNGCPARSPVKQAHRRGGVAAIDLAGRRREQAPLAVHDEHLGLGLLDLDAEARASPAPCAGNRHSAEIRGARRRRSTAQRG